MLRIEDLTENITLPVKNWFSKKQQPEQIKQEEKPKLNLDEFFSNTIKGILGNFEGITKAEQINTSSTIDNLIVHPKVTPPSPKIDIDKTLQTIANNETGIVTGDKYAFYQPSGIKKYGNAMGKYQVTEDEIKTWGKEFMGRNITPKEFQNSPDLQEEYMRNKVQSWIDYGVSLEGILALHNKGMSQYRNKGVVDQRIKDAGDYVPKGVNFYKSLQ